MARNVLHISQSDSVGGSARSAYRIHDGLRRLGHVSHMLVGERATSDPDVRPLKRHLGWRLVDRVVGAPLDRADLQYVLYPSSFGVAWDPWFREADVVQLYNTHGSYFSHSALPVLSRRRPIVWRLSDMWPLTGHVAYSYDCERWRHGCGDCPYLYVYPRLRRDTTARLWRWKQRVYTRSRITLVAPSRWMEDLARESPLLRELPVRRIPNGVDLDRFRLHPRADARSRLGLDPDRPVVLFSSFDLDDPRKGGTLLSEALGRLADVDFELVTVGDRPPDWPRPVRPLSRLGAEMPLAYAAADVFVLPTLAENLPNAVIESLASGTPVVSFDVGGVPDAVRHGSTGWLAPLRDVEALAQGIRTFLTDPTLRERVARTCRAVAEREYDARAEAARYAELYEEVLAG